MSDMAQEVGNSNVMYLSIVGGDLVQKSEEGVEGAKRREYELKDGTKGVKWEKHYKNLSGYISKLEFVKTDFGEQLAITLVKGENTARLALGTDSRYFTDFGKKLPNIKLTEMVELNPYDFKKEGKEFKGLSVKQDGVKINDFYWDGSKNINGMPTVKKEESAKFDSDDWKAYFISVKKFLKKEIETVMVPLHDNKINPVTVDEGKKVFEDGIEQIPF